VGLFFDIGILAYDFQQLASGSEERENEEDR
jgi:hypothetical protein